MELVPYEIVKRIQKLDSNYRAYGFILENDEIWKRFCSIVYGGDPQVVHVSATVANLLDEDGRVNISIHRQFCFPIFISRVGYDGEVRQLGLTDEFMWSYPVKEGILIHIFLDSMVKEKGKPAIPIFTDNVRGCIEVEPRNKAGEPIDSVETLVTRKTLDKYYASLIYEINLGYNYKTPNATSVLLRKLFENLIVDLLKQMYGYSNVEPYYSLNNGRHLSLNQLIPNLSKSIKKLRVFDEALCREEQGLNGFLESIKQCGDASAHVLLLEENMEKINQLKPAINRYADLLMNITKKIDLSNEKWVWES